MTIFERTRQRAEIEDYSNVVEHEGVFVEEVPVTTVWAWEKFQDFHTKIKTRGRYPSSPCVDQKCYVMVDDPGPYGYVRGLQGWRSHSRLPLTFSIQDSESFSSFVRTQVGVLGEQLAQDAYDAFCTQVPAETSVANFALEMEDLLTLIPKLGRSLQETVTNLHLGLSFGTLPFIGDVEVLRTIVQSTLTKIDRLKRLNGRTSRLRMKRTGLYEIPFIAPHVDIGTDIYLALAHASAEFTASARLFANLEGLDGLEGVARGLFGALGLNNPLGIIWNALPFSFVLDWVFRFSNVLARWSLNPYVGVWAVDDLTWSLKTTSRWDVFRYGSEGTYPNTEFHYFRVGWVDASHYERNLGLPTSVNYFTVPPTPGQAALGLSLLSALSRYR